MRPSLPSPRVVDAVRWSSRFDAVTPSVTRDANAGLHDAVAPRSALAGITADAVLLSSRKASLAYERLTPARS